MAISFETYFSFPATALDSRVFKADQYDLIRPDLLLQTEEQIARRRSDGNEIVYAVVEMPPLGVQLAGVKSEFCAILLFCPSQLLFAQLTPRAVATGLGSKGDG